jgi:hypothetical protein
MNSVTVASIAYVATQVRLFYIVMAKRFDICTTQGSLRSELLLGVLADRHYYGLRDFLP